MTFYRWIDDRLGIGEVFQDISSKYVPPHVNLFYCFGGLVFTSFLAQVTTGAAMTFYYVPEVTRSLPSVNAITYETRHGWAIRSMHRWIASIMVLSLVCHVNRVYLTGGFKKPRVAHWCRPIHLYRVVRSYWLFPAVRSSRLLGYPYRDRRSRQLPRCWATYRFASSWRSIGWSRDLESLLCSTRACTSPDHRHPDAKPLPVYSKAGDFRPDVGS